MVKFEHKQAIRSAINSYFASHNVDDLIYIFLAVVNYSFECIGALPNLNMSEMYENSYLLDDNDLRLALKELDEFPSVQSAENMLLVILMFCKGFGLSYDDFRDRIIKIIPEST